MIIIRFETPEMERRALGYLAGRFSFKTWANGETAVPPEALDALMAAGITFIEQGTATYAQLIAIPRSSRGRAM